MTAQIPEVLILRGKKVEMTFCPPLPKRHPRITKVCPDPSKISKADSICYSTACWRGYQGTWAIRGDQFFLVRLRGCLKLKAGEPLLANWFTGVLRVPRGKLLHYVHMGFGSVSEKELHLKIEKGRVTASRTIDNRGKEWDEYALTRDNMPGGENKFPGDSEL